METFMCTFTAPDQNPPTQASQPIGDVPYGGNIGDSDPIGDGGLANVDLPAAVASQDIVICFWGDIDQVADTMPNPPVDETWDVEFDGGNVIFADQAPPNAGPWTENNPWCVTYNLSKAQFESDMTDGEIDISYTNWGAAWSGPDNGTNEFFAEVQSVSFDYEFTFTTPSDLDLCIDDPTVDLTMFVSGQTAASALNNFTGTGVSGGNVFDPSAAGANPLPDFGSHDIFYEFVCHDNSVQSSSFTYLVYTEPIPTIRDSVINCVPRNASFLLNSLFENNTTVGGTFSLLNAPDNVANITGNTLSFGDPGCFEIEYTVDDPGDCTPGEDSDVALLFITENPQPSFTVSTGGVCHDFANDGDLDVDLSVTSPTYGATPTYLWSDSTMDLVVNISDPTIKNPTITISQGSLGMNSSETIKICLEETLTTPSGSCSSEPACVVQLCRRLTILNAMCSEECELLPGTSPCPLVSINPFFSVGCLGNYVNFGDVLAPLFVAPVVGGDFVTGSCAGVNAPDVDDPGTLDPLISCLDDGMDVSYFFGLNFPTLDVTNTRLRDLSGAIGDVCDVLLFSIPFPTGIDFSDDGNDLCKRFDLKVTKFKICINITEIMPFGFIGNGFCNLTLSDIIFDPIQELIEATSVNLVWADTDGDGHFDTVLNMGATVLDPSCGTAFVPNNVVGEGTIVVRNFAAAIIPPAGPCSDPPGYNLLDVIPIDAIPIVGPIIESILEAGQCDVNIAPSALTDYEIRVINDQDPIFLNCPDSLVFANGLQCRSAVDWSDPVAVDGCTGEIVFVQQLSGISSGTLQDVGRYPVEYVATACNGRTDTCRFDVIVTPEEPTLQCPPNITVNTDVDVCNAVVTGITPLQGLGCVTTITWTAPGAIPASGVNDASGVTFPLGTTAVTYTMTYVDEDGNTITQTCSFNVTVVDNQKPTAICQDVIVRLDANGMASVTVDDVDGGSFDNCTSPDDLDIQISRIDEMFTDTSVLFTCEDIGDHTVILRVIDEAGNERRCLSHVIVEDYFTDFVLTLDVPELCVGELNDEQLDFSNYLTIAEPDGTIVPHVVEQTNGDNVVGLFFISSFLPSPNSPTNDPGTINALSGEYTPGTGTGFVSISYILSIAGSVMPGPTGNQLDGCFILTTDVFELRQPLSMGNVQCECSDDEVRTVELGFVNGGLEPYTIQYSGAQLDFDSDGIADDSTGMYVYNSANGYDETDFTQFLGDLLVNYTQPVWSFTIVDARGCELFQSGSCDIDDATEGPTIPCMDNVDSLFTETYVCESQYTWMHPLPFDNCKVVIYDY
ncbi:MAG: hypothetical protein R3275_12125, partial [Saprospiraceae bacterium]|nr:hypothetical protein [Saprospiraceae bacterium]